MTLSSFNQMETTDIEKKEAIRWKSHEQYLQGEGGRTARRLFQTKLLLEKSCKSIREVLTRHQC